MPPVLFYLRDPILGQGNKGIPAIVVGRGPLPAKSWVVSGVTKDETGAVLAGCTVDLFLTSTNVLVDSVVSDGNGYYEFRSAGPAEQYKAVAYHAGAPDKAGSTRNDLVGV